MGMGPKITTPKGPGPKSAPKVGKVGTMVTKPLTRARAAKPRVTAMPKGLPKL